MQTQPTITNSFIALAITNGFSNPLEAFKMQEKLFDYTNDNQKMWDFLVIKSFEQNSKCRPLAQYLIKEGIVPMTELILQSATLNYIQLVVFQETYNKEFSQLNSILNEVQLKVVAKNPLVEEMISFDEFIFNMCNTEELTSIYRYMNDKNLTPYIKHIKQLELLSV